MPAVVWMLTSIPPVTKLMTSQVSSAVRSQVKNPKFWRDLRRDYWSMKEKYFY